MQTYFFWRQRFGDNAVATRVWQGKEPRFKGATVEFPTEEEELEAFDRISGAAKVTKTKKSTAARVAREASGGGGSDPRVGVKANLPQQAQDVVVSTMYNHTPVSVTVRAELRQWGEPLRVLSPATEEFVSSVGNVGTYYLCIQGQDGRTRKGRQRSSVVQRGCRWCDKTSGTGYAHS